MRVDGERSGDRLGDSEGALRTFLIADVRGYTRFSDALGDHAASDLARRFAAIVRAVVEPAGGELLELRGDEALCVFASARAALSTAVELQRRLREPEDDEAPLALGVGIGVDAGEAVPTEGGYRGRALNIAARLCSLARPGEILASETVANLAGHLASARYEPRRPVHVKGVGTAVRLVEVVPGVALPPLPPPPAAADSSARSRTRRRRSTAVAVGATAIALAGGIAAVLVRGGGGVTDEAVVDVFPNSIAVIDPGSDRVVASIAVGRDPGPVVVGEGAVWVANTGDGTVSRIDPERRAVVATIGVGVDISDLAVGAGAVWVAGGRDRALVRIDVEDNKIRRRLVVRETIGPLPAGYEKGDSGVAFGAGAVWLAHGEEVSRIDPATTRVVDTIPAGGSWATAIAAGEGGVWVAQNDRVNVRPGSLETGVAAIDAATGSVEATIPMPGLRVPQTGPSLPPDVIAVGAGAVWAAAIADDVLWRIDPRTYVVAQTIPAGTDPTNVAVGEGAVWVENHSDGSVSRIDPFENTLVRSIAIGRPTRGIAAGEGAVWVSVTR